MFKYLSDLSRFVSAKSDQHLDAWRRSLLRLITDGSFRSSTYLRCFQPQSLLQPNSYTEYDRYPEIFSAVQNLLAHTRAPKLLSFGCSTGAEALSLRHYFPEAYITGCDINKWALRECVRKISDNKISFVASTESALAAQGPFDAVFCMAVLQRRAACQPHVQDCSSLFPFATFDKQISALNKVIKPGGLLIAHLTNFRVTDAHAARRYQPVEMDTTFLSDTPLTAQFDAQCRRIPDRSYKHIIFRKIPAETLVL
jgi:ubiquinone/menaquinone biosynthesis C-methylase UbiE